jgi:hypothetical protein
MIIYHNLIRFCQQQIQLFDQRMITIYYFVYWSFDNFFNNFFDFNWSFNLDNSFWSRDFFDDFDKLVDDFFDFDDSFRSGDFFDDFNWTLDDFFDFDNFGDISDSSFGR